LLLTYLFVEQASTAQDQQVSQYLASQKTEQLLPLEHLINTNGGALNIEGVLNVDKQAAGEYRFKLVEDDKKKTVEVKG